MRLFKFYSSVTNRILLTAAVVFVLTAPIASSAMAQTPPPPNLPGSAQTQDQNQKNPQSLPPATTQNSASDKELSEMLGTAESKEDIEEKVREDAFDAALQGLLPLKPLEIRKLLEHFDRTQESVEVPVYPSPKPEVTVQTLSLDPGSTPAVIKVAYGHVTTLNMLDLSGEPWPIEDISWAGNFEVIEGGANEGSHILRISPESEFAQGNISIRMLNLNTPVIMSLETNRDIVHYRFDAIIPEYGPQADTPLIESNGLAKVNAGGEKGRNIASFLAGVLPDNATRLAVSGGGAGDGRTTAFRVNGLTYVRTPLVLLSPGWNSSAASADGMRVYEIKDTPVLLLSDNGKMVRVKLSEREDILE